MKNTCQNLIQQYQNIILLKQEFVFICKKGVETKDPEKVKEVKKELGRRVKELQENIEVYLDQTVEYLEDNMTRRSKRVIIQLQKALNEGAKEVGEEPKVIGEDLPVGGYHLWDKIILNTEGEIIEIIFSRESITSINNMNFPDSLERFHLNNTKIASLDNVRLPDGLLLFIIGTPLVKGFARLQALKAKYPKIKVFP